MEISFTGIEQAVEGLGYRSDKTPKSRLVNTIRKQYLDSGAVESVGAIDSDKLIDLMWELDGDEKAIRSKRKNLNSVKSSVNADLKEAFKLGKNPEGITIGPSNNFIMSDAAKDKILNSFSGAMNLEGGDTLDRVTEALKIVSEYLANLPGGLEDDKLSNLKSLVEGLAEKFKDSAGPGEFEITEKRPEGEDGAADDAVMEEEIIEEIPDESEADDFEIIEVTDEEDGTDESEEIELVDEDEILEDDEEKLLEEETEIEEITGEDLIDYEEVIEDDPEDVESEDTEVVEVMDQVDTDDESDEDGLEIDEVDELEPEAPDDMELVDEAEDLDRLQPDDMEIVDVVDEDDTVDESDEVELVDEDEILEDSDDEEAADFEEDDLVEVMDEADIAELDNADIIGVEEVLEEVEVEETEPDDEINIDDLGLPLDQLAEEALNFEEFQPDEEQKRLLAERFDGYLGAMERYYNQYIIVKKGNYTIGVDETEADVLGEQKVSLPDYYVGKYPVTNALFEVFIERTGYKTTAERLGFGYVYHGRFEKTVDPKTGLSRSVWNPSYTREKVDGATWYQPTGPGSTLHQKRNHPVVQVSMKDARTFAAWTGKRLPSEIEWEAAARTRLGFIYPWGNEWKNDCCNSENSGVSDTCPVDTYPQGNNETGLADLLGNVLEWTASECEPKYPMENPARFFIARGGSWVSHEKPCLFERTRFGSDFTANILGFRCLAD